MLSATRDKLFQGKSMKELLVASSAFNEERVYLLLRPTGDFLKGNLASFFLLDLTS